MRSGRGWPRVVLGWRRHCLAVVPVALQPRRDRSGALVAGLLSTAGRASVRQHRVDPEVHTTGLYWLDLDDEAEALAWAAREQRPLSAVDISAAYDAVPVLGPGFKHAIYMAGVANVRNPRLVKSLKAALLALPNVSLREHCQITGFVQEKGRVTGVQTADGVLAADEVVLSAGAWSGDLLRTLGLELPVEPVKGQMILFKCAEDFLPSMVLAKGRYAIPRRDGHILVGSTLEHAGYDKTRPRMRWKA